MNKRFFYLLIIFFMSFSAVYAESVSIDQAAVIAKDFISSPDLVKGQMRAPDNSLSLAYQSKACYVFNNGSNGFIIVAGDDRVPQILGYSDGDSFNEASMPSNFNYWFKGCENYINAVVDGSIICDLVDYSKAPKQAFAKNVEPLLGDINFDQDKPYNNKCPQSQNQKSLVGCVAVSMGHIMTYYQWPFKGKGSNSYTTETERIKVSADLNATYDWKNIKHSYLSNAYTKAEADAVSTMLYHCGVAVNMDYSVDGSGAMEQDVPHAMTEYFSYDKGIRVLTRKFYNMSDWKDIIKTELNAKRPIIYVGSDPVNGGHAFNCDGYDANDLFHINWGWSGDANGFYDLRLLNYDSQSGFSEDQAIVIGIKPDKGDGTETKTELVYDMKLDKGLSYDESTGYIACDYFNYGGGNFDGEVAFGIFKDGKLTHTLASEKDIYTPLTGFADFSISAKLLPKEAPYTIRIVYKETGSTEWVVMEGAKGMPVSLYVTSVAGQLSIEQDASELSQLRLEYIKITGQNLKKGNLVCHVKIQNVGDSDFNGMLAAGIGSDDEKTNIDSDNTPNETIYPSETRLYEFTFSAPRLKDGQYYISIYFDTMDGWMSIIPDHAGNGYIYFDVMNGSVVNYDTVVATENINELDFKLYSANGILHIDGITEEYTVYNQMGSLIYRGMNPYIELPRGFYIVKMANEVQKVIVK